MIKPFSQTFAPGEILPLLKVGPLRWMILTEVPAVPSTFLFQTVSAAGQAPFVPLGINQVFRTKGPLYDYINATSTAGGTFAGLFSDVDEILSQIPGPGAAAVIVNIAKLTDNPFTDYNLAAQNTFATLALDRMGVLAVQVAGTFTGLLLAFEFTVDGVNWFPAFGYPQGGGFLVSTANATGVWKFRVEAEMIFRVRTAALATGTVTGRMAASIASTDSLTFGGAGFDPPNNRWNTSV